MSLTPPLTRFMATLAWTCGGAALTSVVLPPPAGALGALLIGAASLLGLRAPALAAMRVAVLTAAMLACASIALAISREDPGAALDGLAAALRSPALRDPGTWLPALVSAVLVLGAAPLASWAAAGLAASASGATRFAAKQPRSGPVPARPRPLVLSQVEAELARSAEELRDLSLALLGVDSAGEADPTPAMRLLDEAVASSLTASDSVCEYGPTERLVVLPDVAAPALRAGAAQLCVAGAELVGRPVRAALATFPADGSTFRHLLDRLELDLAACRAQGTTIAPVAARQT